MFRTMMMSILLLSGFNLVSSEQKYPKYTFTAEELRMLENRFGKPSDKPLTSSEIEGRIVAGSVSSLLVGALWRAAGVSKKFLYVYALVSLGIISVASLDHFVFDDKLRKITK